MRGVLALLLLPALLSGCAGNDPPRAASASTQSPEEWRSSKPSERARSPHTPDGRADQPRVSRTSAPTAAPSPSRTGRPVAAFLGDSLTGEAGDVVAADDYVAFTARALGWSAVPFGQGGTGYANAGDAAGEAAYADRVDEVAAAQPDVVVVQGSTNDFVPPDEVRAAAERTFAALHRALPDARVVAVGPLVTPDADPATVERTRDALAEAAAAQDVLLVDPVVGGWLQPTDGLYADGYHPNLQGHAELARRLVAALRAAGVATG